MIKTHPGMSKPHLKPGLGYSRRSPPVSFSEIGWTDIYIQVYARSCCLRIVVPSSSRMSRTVTTMGPGPPDEHITDITLNHRKEQPATLRNIPHDRIAGRRDPLCATCLTLGDIPIGYPVAIQSLSILSWRTGVTLRNTAHQP